MLRERNLPQRPCLFIIQQNYCDEVQKDYWGGPPYKDDHDHDHEIILQKDYWDWEMSLGAKKVIRGP